MNLRKPIILLIALFITMQISAQDIFENGLYAPDLVLRYKKEIKLSEEQENKIKALYENVSIRFTTKKELLKSMVNELNSTIEKTSVSNDQAIAHLEKINKMEFEIKKLKLSALIEVKNTLSSTQQLLLDNYKEENQVLMKEFDIIISQINSGMTVKIKGDGSKKDSVLYIIKDRKNQVSLKEVSDLNPKDIKSISVFKGDSAIKLYGEEGKNGVVVIELKGKVKN